MDEKNRPQLKWIGRRTTTQEGSLVEVCNALPTFEKVPFEYDNQISKNLEVIVRTPNVNNENYYPITTVSKEYKLVQHQEIIDAIKTASDIAGYSTPDSKCYLNITENGERIWFSMDFPSEFSFDPGDGNELTLQFHILNSVDRSIPLCFDMGWYRWICRNGLFSMNRKLASRRRRHTASLEVSQYVDILNTAVDSVEKEVELYKLAHDTTIKVGSSVLKDWINSTLTSRWGLRLAARSYHIIESGNDGKVRLADTPEEDREIAHRVHVTDEMSVPGQAEGAENVYDVINALSWVASHQTTLQTRRWMMKDVATFSNGLIKKFSVLEGVDKIKESLGDVQPKTLLVN